MKRVIARWPSSPKTLESQHAAWAVAGVFAVMTVGQLFSFEKFIPLLLEFGLSDDKGVGLILAALIVAVGVLALPFLLRMKLSVGMRWFSMFAGWAYALIWFLLSVWANASGVPIDNAGLLGASIDLVPGWWIVCVTGALNILVIWASWGLWPSHQTTVKR